MTIKLSEIKVGMEYNGLKIVKLVRQAINPSDPKAGWTYAAKLSNGSWMTPEMPKKASC